VAFLVTLVISCASTIAIGYPPILDLVQIFKNQWIYVLILVVVADTLRKERDRMRLMVAVCLGMMLLAIQPIYNATYDLAQGASLLRHRAVSLIAIQPNIYGGALACFLPFPLLYFSRKIGGKRGRVLFAITTGVAAYVLVLTLSRGSWLAMGAASLFIGVLFERRVLLILVLVALSFPFWVPEEAMDRASEMKTIDVSDPNLRMDEGSAFVRVDQWKMIPRALADAPLLGHGFERFPFVYRRMGAYGMFKGAHVGYCEYATEAGFIGLLLYVLIFVSLGAFGLRLAVSGNSVFARSHGVALLGAAVAMAVAEGFGSRLKVGSVTAFLWMYAGVGVACWRWPVPEPEPDTAAERRGLLRRVARPPSLGPRRPAAGAPDPG
jgi:O-antigen ligase